jgi:hypothetical protein
MVKVESLINKQSDREAKYNQPLKPNADVVLLKLVKIKLKSFV